MPGETPTELQAYTLKCINDAGGLAAVVHSPEEAVALVRKAVALVRKLLRQPFVSDLTISREQVMKAWDHGKE